MSTRMTTNVYKNDVMSLIRVYKNDEGSTKMTIPNEKGRNEVANVPQHVSILGPKLKNTL